MALMKQNILNSQTVFILGAGASKPFDFPLGSELKQEMLANLGNRQVIDILNSAGFSNTIIHDFHEALGYSFHPTIDIFLEKKRKFRGIGAHVIARALIPHENDNQLFPQRDWYGNLFDILDFENEQTDPSYPSIVTLNYDRSLEHFLTKNIDYNCQDEKIELCHSKRGKIKIIHAHGSLGQYPNVPYGINVNDVSALKNAAENIKIVSDRLDDSPDFQEAQQVISKASNIVFFGFGYDEITLSRLLLKSELDSKTFYGTSIQLDQDVKIRLQSKFGVNLVLGENLSCRKLLEEIRKAMK